MLHEILPTVASLYYKAIYKNQTALHAIMVKLVKFVVFTYQKLNGLNQCVRRTIVNESCN